MINTPGEYGLLCHIIHAYCTDVAHSQLTCLYINEQNKVQCITSGTMILL